MSLTLISARPLHEGFKRAAICHAQEKVEARKRNAAHARWPSAHATSWRRSGPRIDDFAPRTEKSEFPLFDDAVRGAMAFLSVAPGLPLGP